ncbi:MAG: putative signal transducing protein [Flavobacteriales bacterium]
MEKGWVKILTESANDVELKCALLKSHGINAVIINKQDSSYLFGSAELYVTQDDVIRSKRILNEEDA